MSTSVLEKPKTGGQVTRSGRRRENHRLALDVGASADAPPKQESGYPWAWRRRIKEWELVPLCQHLAALVSSGISLDECLRTFAEETPPGPLRHVLGEIMADIEAGRKLSDALDRHPQHFSAYFRASIWAGEESGSMSATLDRLARYLEARQETKQRIRNAFAYPVVLSIVIVGVVTFLMLYVVPVFANVYKRMGVDLPIVTQTLIDFSQLLLTSPWVLALPAGLGIGFWLWTSRTPTGRLWLDTWKVRVPIIGPLLKKTVLYRFIRSFGEIMGAGVLVLNALDLAGQVAGNTAFIAALEAVRADVQRGTGLTGPLRRTGWFSPSILQVISTGERSGRVPTLLACAADILRRDTDLTLKRVVGRIEPLLTVLMAVVVGVILLAVYLPMFDVMQNVGK